MQFKKNNEEITLKHSRLQYIQFPHSFKQRHQLEALHG